MAGGTSDDSTLWPGSLAHRGLQRRGLRFCVDAAGRVARSARQLRRPEADPARLHSIRGDLRAGVLDLVRALRVLPQVRGGRSADHLAQLRAAVPGAVLRLPVEVRVLAGDSRAYGTTERVAHDRDRRPHDDVDLQRRLRGDDVRVCAALLEPVSQPEGAWIVGRTSFYRARR